MIFPFLPAPVPSILDVSTPTEPHADRDGRITAGGTMRHWRLSCSVQGVISALAILTVSTASSIAGPETTNSLRYSAKAAAGVGAAVEYSRRFTAPLNTHGALVDRRVVRTTHRKLLREGRKTELVGHVFLSNYTKRKRVIERVLLERTGDGWRLVEHIVGS
ncbi:MAG: hypothetical protein DWQ08_01145 [Proteobacteria bacterium]|nr:MAG: hypothetical protein DWQ08_01145 [Pseudomonadota bacterium]